MTKRRRGSKCLSERPMASDSPGLVDKTKFVRCRVLIGSSKDFGLAQNLLVQERSSISFSFYFIFISPLALLGLRFIDVMNPDLYDQWLYNLVVMDNP